MNETTPVRRGYLERLERENAALRAACQAAITYISLVCGTDRTATLDKLRAVLAECAPPPPAAGGG